MYDNRPTHSKRVHVRIKVIWTCRTMGVVVALWKDRTRENLDFGNLMEIKHKVKTRIEQRKFELKPSKQFLKALDYHITFEIQHSIMHIAFIHNNIEMHKIDKEVGSNFINLGQITTQSKWKKIGDLRGMFKLVNLGRTTLDLKWKKKKAWICFDWITSNHTKVILGWCVPPLWLAFNPQHLKMKEKHRKKRRNGSTLSRIS